MCDTPILLAYSTGMLQAQQGGTPLLLETPLILQLLRGASNNNTLDCTSNE